jgi:D-glycero-D-manno-heptose 1,7-bisphosphate phosphatase
VRSVTPDLRPAIFLDRDGVINENRAGYVKSWNEVRILPGALDALRSLARLDWPIVVVSNQSVIGRGLTSGEAVKDIHARLREEAAKAGGRIDAFYYCPHRPDEGCDCRKPAPGLLLQAARELGIDLRRSYMVGDAEEDAQAALAAGCGPILVKTGRGQAALERMPEDLRAQCLVAEDLAVAAQWILAAIPLRLDAESLPEPAPRTADAGDWAATGTPGEIGSPPSTGDPQLR